MSRDAESLLHRWSRRKQATQRLRPAPPHELQDSVRPAAAMAVTRPDDPIAEPAAASLPEPLPRLEDLTADSNLAAFLRKAVPDALRNAALRKMWSLDPAIRDHVGLAECAWNFNQPDSIPGFGSLAKTSAPAFLSQWAVGGCAAPEAAPSSLRRPDLEAKPVGACASADEPEAAPPVQGAATDEAAGSKAEAGSPPTIARRTAQCRHGSALPRSRGGR